MSKLKETIPEPVLKALYAGWKYQLALDTAMGEYRAGKHDTQTNAKMMAKYYKDWKRYTAKSIKLLEEE